MIFHKCNISFFRVLNILLSVSLIFISRIILPNTDEADYPDRVNNILNADEPFFAYYQYLRPLLNDLDWTKNTLDFKSYVLRVLFTIIIFLPIYLYILKSKKNNLKNNQFWLDKTTILIFTLLFPSIWFHLGLYSEESFVLMLFLLIIFIDSIALKTILFIAASLIDIGNTSVFLLYYIFYFATLYSIYYFKKKYTVLFLLIFLLTCNFYSMDLLYLIEWLPIIGEKVSFIISQYQSLYDINNKYPLILRPIISFISIIFMLPVSHLMVWPIYPFCFYFSIKTFRLLISSKFKNDKISASFLASLTLVISVPMILPGFSNGKYYVFVIPYIINSTTYLYNKLNIYYFILLCNLIVFLFLFLNYLNTIT